MCMDIWKLGIYKKREENEKEKRQVKKKHLRHPLNSIRRNISMQIEYFKWKLNFDIVRGLKLVFAKGPTTINEPENEKKISFILHIILNFF